MRALLPPALLLLVASCEPAAGPPPDSGFKLVVLGIAQDGGMPHVAYEGMEFPL